MFLIVCFLQFLNFQRNNKTIIYRLLDVANQVDWVSAHREATPPITLFHHRGRATFPLCSSTTVP